MKKTLLALTTLCIALFTQAQDVNTMYINYKNGETVEIEISEIGSITFTATEPEPEEDTIRTFYNPSVAFQDGVDFGEEGTLLKISDVIGNNYYITNDYDREITLKTANGETFKTSTIKAGIVDDVAKADWDLNHNHVLNLYPNGEWLYYKNNGAVIQNVIQINIPIYYGITAGTIIIDVKPTNNENTMN